MGQYEDTTTQYKEPSGGALRPGRGPGRCRSLQRADVGSGRRDHAGIPERHRQLRFIPYYPVWSLLIIALNVFVIWALAAHGREMAID